MLRSFVLIRPNQKLSIMFNSFSLFFVLVTIGLSLVSEAKPNQRSFNEWLSYLDGSLTYGINYNDFTFDNINLSLRDWDKAGFKVPPELLEISHIDYGSCDSYMKGIMEDELIKKAKSNSLRDQYFRFFAKLKFNFCLQDLEFKRAQVAIQKMDLAKWLAWHYAMNENQNNSKDLKKPTEKLANYLKRYVPEIDVGTPDQQMTKVDTEIKSIIEAICPYVTKEFMRKISTQPANIDYFKERRQLFGADDEAHIWASSRAICEDKNLQSELIKGVANYMMTKLNSIDVKDSKLADITDAKVLYDILFATSKQNLHDTHLIRAGNVLDLLQKLADIPGENQKIAQDLVTLKTMYKDWHACQVSYNEQRVKFANKYRDNEPISIYINATNALQYHVCDIKLRFEAANLAHELSSYQIARLAELRYVVLVNQGIKDDKAQFINPKNKFGISAQKFINRYRGLNSYYNANDRDYHHNLSTLFASDNDLARRTYQNRKGLQEGVRSFYIDVMNPTCKGVLGNFSEGDVDFLERLLELEAPHEKLGVLTTQMVDYAILCQYVNGKGFNDLMDTVKSGTTYG